MGRRIVPWLLSCLLLAALFPWTAAADTSWIDNFSALEIDCKASPAEGFSQSGPNTLRVEVRNYGNTHLRDVRVTLILPKGIVPLEKSATESMGMMASGDKKALTFALSLDKDLEAKTYPITVQAEGSSYNGQAVSTAKTFYLPVEGVSALDLAAIEILGIQLPKEVSAGESFSLSFTVANRGARAITGMKISAEPPEGVHNLSRNTFLDDFGPGQSKTYHLVFSTFLGLEDKGCAVKLTAAPGKGEDAPSVSQYATTQIKSGSSSVKTPLLMVSGANYGGRVEAGDSFLLQFSVVNTSDQRLTNVKISLNAEESAFLPKQGSNTVYLNAIEPKDTKSQSVALSVKPDAAQKPTAITVSMAYENGKGEAYTAEDTISIPVVQSDRLSVGEVTPPYELYVGNPAQGEIEFYNMGKSQLNNLTVHAEGNFDAAGSGNSYFVGNMASGASDSFTFNLMPNEVGPVEGEIVFTYEDGGGQSQEVRKAFSFEAMEMPVYEDSFPTDEGQEQPFPWSIVIAGAVLLLGILLFLRIRKIRKKRLHDSLELEDETLEI